MKFIYVFILSYFFVGCYTVKQSTLQLKLLLMAKALTVAIQENKDKPDRLEKLNIVNPVLEYAKMQIGLIRSL